MTGAITDREIVALSAVSAAELVRSNRLTPERIEAAQLRRIASRDSDIQAWVRVAEPMNGKCSPVVVGPLSGVSVGVKDIFDTADMITAYGSPVFAENRTNEDALVVSRLRRAGARILGKTHTTEFACFHPAPTRNPLDLCATPGGSSSGSAAAVADGMIPIGLGSQTAGSTIRPAAFCGIFGLKPTHGLIPLEGVMRLAQSLDTVGLFARHLEDFSLILSVLTDSLWESLPTEDPPCGFVIFRGPHWHKVSPETVSLFDRIVEKLPKIAPCRVINEIAGFERLTLAQETVMAREVYENFQPVVDAHPDQISVTFRNLCHRGRLVTESEYRKALLYRNEGYCVLQATLAPGELIVTPAAPGVAPNRSEGTGDPTFNRMWTLLGVPCLSVPFGRSDRLPLAIQVLGKRGDDRNVLAAGAWLSGRWQGILKLNAHHISPDRL